MRTADEIRYSKFMLLLKEAGSVKAMAERSGVSSAQISQIKTRSAHSKSGKPRTIGDAQARKLEEVFNKPRGWMDSDDNAEGMEIAVPSGSRIPVVGRARLGDNGHFVELEYPVGHGDGYIDLPSNDPNAYALRCEGDSMQPRIRHGEFVIVEPNRTVQPGDEVLVKARDGRVMVKQFLYRRDDRVTLLSVNEAHPSVSIAAADIEAMHYVSAIVKAIRWRPE